ncbi:cytosolic protein [Virgibacillus phasianinus]|uniref:Cytosolic protein n=1 Tax=Virgibacillus phasianinus TaxID=2017483 RepID=A0A220U4G1_9BACI|nr:cytosolic protein [Virgibacillus phasianinus]ASK62997.1 cytosolic protein [Virgibacillus phasianinus]
MSFKENVVKYLSNHAETRDNHSDESLQTHYYKTTKDKALAKLEEIVSNSKLYSIHSVSKEHGELSLYYKKTFIIATVISVRPYNTAIDFSVTTETPLPFDFGNSSRMIERLYQQLNNELPYIEKMNQ